MAYDYLTPTDKKYKKNTQVNVENTNSTTESTPGDWIGKGVENKSTYTPKGTSTNYGSYEDDLKRLTEAKRQSQINQLKQARQTALNNLDAQEQTIKPAYQNQRNLASAQSQSGARSFQEYMANRGLTNSGASVQGEINRQSALQNTMGNIGTAEANAYRDIANQRTQVENDYVAGLANANSALDAEYYNNLLNYNQQQRAMAEQLRQQSLGQYANDYQAQIDNLIAQGYSPNSMEVLQLEALKGNKVANNYANANSASNALASIQAGNINYNNAAALGWTVEQAQQYYNNLVEQAKIQAEREAEQLAYDRQQDAFNNSIKAGQLANQTRQTNYNVNKPYYAPSRSSGSSSSSSSRSSNTSSSKTITPSYSAHKNYIDKNFAIKDAYGDVTGYDTNAILNYIKNENDEKNSRMSDSDAVNLLYNYGMKEIADELIGG